MGLGCGVRAFPEGRLHLLSTSLMAIWVLTLSFGLHPYNRNGEALLSVERECPFPPPAATLAAIALCTHLQQDSDAS